MAQGLKSELTGDGPMDFVRENKIWINKIGIIVGVYLGMKYLVPLVIPFLIAVIVVCWCQPLLRWAKRRLHLRPACTMALLLILVFALTAGGLYLAGRKAGGSLANFFSGKNRVSEAEQLLEECCDSIGELLQVEPEEVQVFVTEQINVFRDQAVQNIWPGAFDGSLQVVKGTTSVLAGILVTGISLLLLAGEFEKIKEAGQSNSLYTKSIQIVKRILHSVGSYLKAQGLIMLLVMTLCAVGIWLSGSSKSPILAGVLTGFLDALPVLGTGVVFGPWVILEILRKNYTAAIILGITYGVCTLTRELLEPKLVGSKLGISPILILMSVWIGIKMYGPGGILQGPLSLLLIQELWREN